MAKRYIVDDINVQENVVTAKGSEIHHINVMRYKVGDRIYINEYYIEITSIADSILTGNIIGILKENGVPNIDVTLYMCYLKADKMDYVVQKAVELGASKIVPLISKNTVVKLDAKDRLKKKERLQKIVTEAIGQCGRTDNVDLGSIWDIKEIEKEITTYDLVLICHEQEKSSLTKCLHECKEKNINSIAVIVGPEGGLDTLEVEKLLEYSNVKAVCFGERILRAETAANYILSILDYEFNSNESEI